MIIIMIIMAIIINNHDRDHCQRCEGSTRREQPLGATGSRDPRRCSMDWQLRLSPSSYLFHHHHHHHHHILFIIIQGGPLACQRCLLSLDQITTGSRKILISPNNETSHLCCVLMLMVGWSVKQIKYVLTKTCLKRRPETVCFIIRNIPSRRKWENF